MAHAQMVKWLLMAVLAFHAITFLTGCKEDERAQRLGQEATRDSPGWARLRQQEALPPELRDKGGPPKGPISREW